MDLCNVYCRFVDCFTPRVATLKVILRQGQPQMFVGLDGAQIKSFRALIWVTTSPPVLSIPRPGFPYSIDTATGSYKVICAFFQMHPPSKPKPIGFWSRSLNPGEGNYSSPELDCLALQRTVQTLGPYLMYERLKVYTNEADLHSLRTVTEPPGRLTRRRLRLAEFNFKVKHKTGKANAQADALSRSQTIGRTAQHYL